MQLKINNKKMEITMKITSIEENPILYKIIVLEKKLNESNKYIQSNAFLDKQQYLKLSRMNNKIDQLNYLITGDFLEKNRNISKLEYENANEIDLHTLKKVDNDIGKNSTSQKVDNINEKVIEVYKGLIKLVPLEKQYKQNLNLTDLELQDTMTRTEDGIEQLKFKISYLDGSAKQSDGISIQNYATTGELVAYGKEARVLSELGKYAPVKVVCTRLENERNTQMKVECVQSQAMGMEKTVDQSINQAPTRGIDI